LHVRAQSEALTTRLKHIIEDYADGPGILLELLQNADDAGASSAAFLLDLTTYGSASVLGAACHLLPWCIFRPETACRAFFWHR
jgi:hypothetical protein